MISEELLIFIIAGFCGGIIRNLVGYMKSKKRRFNVPYFFSTLIISGLIGAAAGALADTKWQVSFLAGYAGTDFLEGIYKIRTKKK